MYSVDTGKVSQLIEIADYLSKQEIKTLLLKQAMRIFPNFPKKVYVKKSSGACMKGYDNQCYTRRKDYHKGKNKYNEGKCNISYTEMIKKSKKIQTRIKEG